MITAGGLEIAAGTPTSLIPSTIREAYGLDETTTVRTLGGGHVNDTLLVTTHGEYSILQKQSAVLDNRALLGVVAVSQHLTTHGWEAPSLIPTVTGSLWASDEIGQTWRRQTFIDSDGMAPQVQGPALLEAAGDMLGRWHHTNQTLNYRLDYGMAHFHDTDHFAHRLTNHAERLPQESQQLGAMILHSYQEAPTITKNGQQLIHGDPKFDNMLFRDGKPFTLVDFDTLMVGSPWLDMGDMLRSLLRDQIVQGKPASTQSLQPAIAAYHEASNQSGSFDYSRQLAMAATGRIALELGMRYLCDTVEASYFSWDSERYDSRHEHHYAKAQLQLQIAQLAIDSIN